MDDHILAIYCVCHDFLNALHHREDRQQKMTDAEVMTTALVARLFLGGNFEPARALLGTAHYIPTMLSRSRLNRRLYQLQHLFATLFDLLGQTWKELNGESIYIIDSFPVAVCDNYRIPHAHIYDQEAYRGYIASKKRYFYGLKIHLLVTPQGHPVECFLTPGSSSDVRALRSFQFDVPKGSVIYADKAYNDYGMEDLMYESVQIELSPIRKEHSKRALPPYMAFVQHYYRKRIETAASLIARRFPNTIHAVTAHGFELKVFLFVLAYSIDCL
jgi:Transposase DDE domain